MTKDSESSEKKLSEAALLARYKENCDQARHHETLRERTTAMVASIAGVLLGLLGLKDGATASAMLPVVGVFIGVLGVWGLLSVETFEKRAREHRFRIRKIVAELKGEGRPVEEKVHLLNWVWRTFHVLIALLGVLLVYWYFCEPTWLPRSAG
jgi:hypothetical protein